LDEGDTYLNGTHSEALEKVLNFYKLCSTEKQVKEEVEEVAQVCHGVMYLLKCWNVFMKCTVFIVNKHAIVSEK
jgi:hypothetical protein